MVAALAALVLDGAFGEPPSALHPVVWMGQALRAGRRAGAGLPPRTALLAGAALVAAGGAAAWGAGALAERALARVPGRQLARGAVLKPALAPRALLDAGASVETALRNGNLEEARRLLAWHLVSRDTSALSASEVAGAAIASLAENLCDAVVAPLLAFRVAGLPGAYLHRWLNTADAVLGYRTPELEWFGKAAARADDAANWLPARLSALCIVLAATCVGADAKGAARAALRDAGRTPSPNGGWPMSAAAGALGVRLEKRGVYVLNADGAPATVDDLRRARRLVGVASALALLLAEAA
ncbi:adenosylcobinamide-phosphate synthase CbiB [Longimicrobium sp.]|uniref:adenosylcobinamide-phosphate synthase CbiB n=1 Tax=Longimicrobium sp. TaxID=2029185 RepID=UPI002E30B307|nr:adenosylcobinamide-phosphate synthase CbiB [Longimicrobium sp.]HEX6037566.1 adenosylcobinamide-phosphate synthase CbiB [Longimicrobium sp.]